MMTAEQNRLNFQTLALVLSTTSRQLDSMQQDVWQAFTACFKYLENVPTYTTSDMYTVQRARLLLKIAMDNSLQCLASYKQENVRDYLYLQRNNMNDSQQINLSVLKKINNWYAIEMNLNNYILCNDSLVNTINTILEPVLTVMVKNRYNTTTVDVSLPLVSYIQKYNQYDPSDAQSSQNDGNVTGGVGVNTTSSISAPMMTTTTQPTTQAPPTTQTAPITTSEVDVQPSMPQEAIDRLIEETIQKTNANVTDLLVKLLDNAKMKELQPEDVPLPPEQLDSLEPINNDFQFDDDDFGLSSIRRYPVSSESEDVYMRENYVTKDELQTEVRQIMEKLQQMTDLIQASSNATNLAVNSEIGVLNTKFSGFLQDLNNRTEYPIRMIGELRDDIGAVNANISQLKDSQNSQFRQNARLYTEKLDMLLDNSSKIYNSLQTVDSELPSIVSSATKEATNEFIVELSKYLDTIPKQQEQLVERVTNKNNEDLKTLERQVTEMYTQLQEMNTRQREYLDAIPQQQEQLAEKVTNKNSEEFKTLERRVNDMYTQFLEMNERQQQYLQSIPEQQQELIKKVSDQNMQDLRNLELQVGEMYSQYMEQEARQREQIQYGKRRRYE